MCPYTIHGFHDDHVRLHENPMAFRSLAESVTTSMGFYTTDVAFDGAKAGGDPPLFFVGVQWVFNGFQLVFNGFQWVFNGDHKTSFYVISISKFFLELG